MEADLNTEWQEKCNRLLSAAAEKHQRSINDTLEEKKRAEAKVTDLELKVCQGHGPRT